MRATILPLLLFASAFASPCLAADANPLHLSASVSASTSTVINDIVFNKPQYGANLDGWYGHSSFGVNIASAYSGNNGTDHQDKYFVAYDQKLVPFDLKYQVTLKTYPGTREGLNDNGVDYAVTASQSVDGISYSFGVDYTGEDYTTTRKSYGFNVSLGHSFAPKLSGWLSISHHHQFGSVDYTNTNLGLYYSLNSKMGVSTSINNWHAYADWGRDRPSLSISLSRRL